MQCALWELVSFLDISLVKRKSISEWSFGWYTRRHRVGHQRWNDQSHMIDAHLVLDACCNVEHFLLPVEKIYQGKDFSLRIELHQNFF